MDINTLYSKYSNIDFGDLTRNHKDELKFNLSEYKASDIITIDEHKKFLELLGMYRQILVYNLDDYGKNFKKTIESLLSVGEDGVYSNSLRFLFELIQNVDDCEYSSSSKCVLDVKFDTGNDIITLMYNENGFTPYNVFAITGIAEEAKNITADKIEIGEKGIGFKSVFGIANSVLIESGLFAFELFSDNFIVPKVRYNGFKGIHGTRLTLKLKSKLTQGIYRELAGRYSKPDVLFTKNPILFLNQLTDIKFYIDDSFRYLKFHVEREGISTIEKTIEKNILISVDIKDEDNKRTKKDEINCLRYTAPIVYNRNACVSRYSIETKHTEKKHNIVAIIPYPSELSKSGHIGALYSFLPTQILMNIPVALHVPYKLDSSREFVDPQGGNEWFTYTNNKLYEFIKWVYLDLASRIKEEIISYLPKTSDYFFDNNIECLKRDIFKAEVLLNERVFYSAGGTFEKASDIVSFNSSEGVKEPKTIYSLLELPKKLYIPSKNTDMRKYGVEVLNNAYLKLFINSCGNPKITEIAFEILSKCEDFDFNKALETAINVCFSLQQIETIFKYEKISSAFQKKNEESIKAGKRPLFNIDAKLPPLSNENLKILEELLEDTEIGKSLDLYFSLIKNRFLVADELPSGCYFAGSESLLLSSAEPLTAFACFVERFGTGTLGANLKIREESEKLNNLVQDKSISDGDYLKLLKRVRNNIIRNYGKKVYANYIKLINLSGVDENRFINELLQNADDCQYTHAIHKNELPFFECSIDGSTLTTYYNEDGFQRKNVRSITAIGESTKKQIQSYDSSIGEKGVGFKSVFSVASEVAIHSNGFHFKLSSELPTVPQSVASIDLTFGTKMVFSLKRPMSDSLFSEESVLRACLSLRKLKKLTLGKYKIEIDDSYPMSRKIFINGDEHSFIRFVYDFTIDSNEAIEQRENHQRIINPNQKIICYIPENSNAKNKIGVSYLYAGLPTNTQINAPLAIDAPFEVTTSRECVIKHLWNEFIREEVYNAFIHMLHRVKIEEKNEVFRFVNEMGLFKNNSWLNIEENYFRSRIANERLVSLRDGSYAAPNNTLLWIYSDISLFMFANRMATIPERNIVDSPKNLRILEWLGCKRNSIQETMHLIKEAVENGNMANTRFRKLLYQLLKDKSREIYENTICLEILKKLTIVPVKPISETETVYISYNSKIYLSSEIFSTNDYYILEEHQLSSTDFNEIFHKDIQFMDDSQKGMLYWEKIRNVLIDNIDKKQVAQFILSEFQNNRNMLIARKNELMGHKSRIPFMFADGKYYIGKAYTNPLAEKFSGSIIKKMIVSSEYKDLAEFLEFESIKSVYYNDFDWEIDVVSAEDIEDLLNNGFDNLDEIIKGFIKDDKIPYEYIAQYELEHFISSDEINQEAYEFPKEEVKSVEAIRNEVLSAKLNRMVSREITEPKWVPELEYKKRDYALEQYRPRNGNGVHFCQMCKKPFFKKYIEVNSIRPRPAFAWEHMRLCLCLDHSKDFESLRAEASIIEKFIIEVQNTSISSPEPIAVPIDDKNIYFTAKHLAYIQEILRREEGLRYEVSHKELLEV